MICALPFLFFHRLLLLPPCALHFASLGAARGTAGAEDQDGKHDEVKRAPAAITSLSAASRCASRPPSDPSVQSPLSRARSEMTGLPASIVAVKTPPISPRQFATVKVHQQPERCLASAHAILVASVITTEFVTLTVTVFVKEASKLRCDPSLFLLFALLFKNIFSGFFGFRNDFQNSQFRVQASA